MTALGGKYQLGDRIGGGGMAEVFHGTIVGAEGFARRVAIKRVLAGFSADPKFGQMFVNEARIASLLHHPNIASVLDFDRDDDDRYYLVMELINGVDLRELEQSGRLPVSVAAFITGEILKGLDYAHSLVHDGRHLRILHRDISPHNVMLSWNGGVKIVDFGIAKALAATDASRTGSLKGKVAYMSPEQANGQSLDARSDLFAVGVMMHELLTGRRLFSGGTEVEVLARLLTQPIASPREIEPSVPDDLCSVAMGLLARDRDQRFDSAGAALEALLSCTSSSARGGLELRSIMRKRFPELVPASADTGRTPAPIMHTPSAPFVAGGSTMTAEPDASRTEPPRRVAAPTAMGEPVAAPAQAVKVSRRGRHSAAFLAGVAALCSAAIVVAVIVKKSRTVAAAEVADAGPIDGGEVAMLTPDASLAVALATDAAAAANDDSTVDDRDRDKRDRDKRDRDNNDKRDKDRRDKDSRAQNGSNGSNDDKRNKDPPGNKDSDRTKDRDKGKDKDRPTAATVKKGTGYLRVKVKTWANVSINGKGVGQTPVRKALSAGKHRVVLSNPGKGKRDSVTVTIEAGRTKYVTRDW